MRASSFRYLAPGILGLTLLLGCERLSRSPGDGVERSSDRFERKRVCMELVTSIHAREQREIGAQMVFNPQYCYSESLNTCLYAGGMIQKGYMRKWVRDCLTNVDIVECEILDSKVVNGLSSDEFEAAKARLMAGCTH